MRVMFETIERTRGDLYAREGSLIKREREQRDERACERAGNILTEQSSFGSCQRLDIHHCISNGKFAKAISVCDMQTNSLRISCNSST